jgi:DNA-binding XRE family transcriptional regulator
LFDLPARTETRTDVVIAVNFEPTAPPAIANTTPIDEYVASLERDSGMAQRIGAARRSLGAALHSDEPESVAAMRLAAGLSQAHLAQRIGTSQSHIACIELGKTDPGTDVINKIARALRADPTRLFRAISAKRAATEEARA